MNQTNRELSKEPYFYAKRYVQEFLEACVGLYIVGLISKSKFEVQYFLRTAAVLGAVTLFLEEYNPSYADTIRQGLAFTIGATTAAVVVAPK